MATRLLYTIRDKINSNATLTRIIVPAVDLYRKAIAAYGPQTTKVTINNTSVKFYTESFEEVRHLYPVLGERGELSDLLSELQPNDTFYDVGAHIGIYTCFVSQIVDSDNVIAFEPVENNVKRLNQNLDLNKISANVHSIALSDTTEQIEMDIDSDSPGTIGHLNNEGADESATITTVKPDEFIMENNIPLPDIIKIDVEGAELKVLRGMSNSLDNCRLIYCEVSDSLLKYGDSEEELVDYLRELGFEIEFLSENDRTVGDLKATRID